MTRSSSDIACGAEPLLAHMQRRAHSAPRRLLEPGPDAAQRRQLFDAAASAPDHGRILPWRLICVERAARPRLADAFEQALLERTPDADAQDRARARERAQHAPFLALAVLRDAGDGHEHIPPLERAISLGAALQNLLLMAHAQGFAAGLVSGRALQSEALRACFGLARHERAVCFIAIGTAERAPPPRERPCAQRFVSELRPG